MNEYDFLGYKPYTPSGVFCNNNNTFSLSSSLNNLGNFGSNMSLSNISSGSNIPLGTSLSNATSSGSLLDSLSSLWNGADNFAQAIGGWGNLLGGLGNLYGMWNQIGLANDALDLARDQFNFSKNFASTQLNNQIDSYNTDLADRARTRAYTETGNANAYKDWYEKNKLNSFNG